MTSLTAPIAAAVSGGERAVAFDAAMIAKLTDVAGDFAINFTRQVENEFGECMVVRIHVSLQS